MEQQIYPLPKKKPIQYNGLVRLLNFDSQIEGMFFIQTHKTDNLIKGMYKIWAYQQDVAEDRTSIFKSSQASKIKRKHERTFGVKMGFYISAGVGNWSDDLPFALIFPDEPDRLPQFIKQIPSFANAFSSIIKDINIDVTITKNLQEQNSRLGEQLLQQQSDRLYDKFMNQTNRVLEVLGLKEKRDQTIPKKEKE